MPSTSSFAAATAAALILAASASPLAHAQTTTTQVVEHVDKYRTWVADTQLAAFQPRNLTANKLPDWSTLVDNPRVSKHSAVVDQNSRLVVFGGESFNPLNPDTPLVTATNNLYLYDFAKNKWYTEVPTTGTDPLLGQVPVARLDHSAWSWETEFQKKFMYVAQGVSDAAFTDVWRYHNRTWAKMPWTLPARHGHCTVPIDGTWAFQFGGRDASGAYTNTMLKVNANGTQFDMPTGPEARALHSCVRIDRHNEGPEIYVLGGTDGDKPLTDIWRYSVLNMTWERINDGSSDTHRSFDNTLLPPIRTEANIRGDCAANFPIINCVGQNFAGTRLVQSFNVVQNRWIRNFFRDPNPLPGLMGHRVIGHSIFGEFEMYVVGGVAGVPAKFQYPTTLFKTRFHMLECRPGFVNGDLDGKCFQCASGYAPYILIDPHTCSLCGPGTFSGDGACRDCPLGTYLPTSGHSNSSACIACPEGYFTVSTGSSALSDCKSCPLGYYAANGGCPPCPAGSYGSMAGGLAYDIGCTPCPFGQWSSPGQTACSDCPPGTSSGKFTERLEPYELYVYNLGAAGGGSTSTATGCPTAIANSVNAGEWFYVGLRIRDIGQDGANPGQTFSYDPLRLPYFAVTPSTIGLTTTFNSYNASGSMYYNCNNNNLPSGCSSVTANQTTPPDTSFTDYQMNCNHHWTRVLVLRLRFDDQHEWVRLTFEAEGIRPATHHLQVLGGNTGMPKMEPNPAYYAGGIPNSLFKVKAYDSKGNFDPSATWTFTLTTQCSGGTAATASFSVDGGGPLTSHSNQGFTDGVWAGALDFANDALSCKFVTRHVQGTTVTTVSPHDPFDSGVPTHMDVTLGSANITNYGIMSVEVRMVNLTNDRVLGDNQSVVRARFSDQYNNHFQGYPHIFIDQKNSPTGLQKMANQGLAVLKLMIYTNLTYPWTVPVKLVIEYLTPIDPPLQLVETERFWISTVNATVLRLVEDTHKFPTQIRANSSFFMEIEAIGSKDPAHGNINPGGQDPGLLAGRPVIPIIIELGPMCHPSLKLRVNTSTVYSYAERRVETSLVYGRTVIKLFLQGNDARGCSIHVWEKSAQAFKELEGFWTPAIDVVTPHHIRHDMTICNPRETGDCTLCELEVGAIYLVNISVFSADGTFLGDDDLTVVKFTSAGQPNASIEVNDLYEQAVKKGKATFTIQIVSVPTEPFKWTFDAGIFVWETKYNITYNALPTFSVNIEDLGVFRTFYPKSYVGGDWTCPLILLTNASKIELNPTYRVPTWAQTQEPLMMQIEAVNIFGIRDTNWNHPFAVEIKHCHTGKRNDFSWIVEDSQGTQTTYNPATAPITVGSFSSGEGFFKVYPDFVHDTGFFDGMRGCSIVVTSNDGLTPLKILSALVVEGFEIFKTRTHCLQCAPGYWSGGGNGRDLSANGAITHPGGCVPCMVGTFSADSGSILESECEVCGTGLGYNIGWTDNRQFEGVTVCNNGCQLSTQGLAGGGGCPSGNIERRAATNGLDLQRGQWGSVGRRCSLGGCIGVASCQPGYFRLICQNLGNQPACEDYRNKGQCTWTGSTCTGAYESCTPCPAGTYNWWWSSGGVGVCYNCEPGGWSETEGLTTVDHTDQLLAEYRCGGETNWERRCTGAGTGQCANGTYSETWGASSNATCIPCPPGYVCHELQMYRWHLGGGHTCPNEIPNPRCTHLPINGATQYNCPLTPHVMRGAFRKTPCPDGTYSNVSGLWDVSQCIPCPGGYSCPPASTEPIYVDTKNSQTDTSGLTIPSHVSFDSHSDKIDCASPLTVAQSDFEGYVHDGHISEFTKKYRHFSNSLDNVFSGFKQWWWGGFSWDNTDRNGDSQSGSIRMENITGTKAWQAVWLNHETPLDMVARVWVYNNLTYKNLSAIDGSMPFAKSRETPFAGLELEVFGTPHWNHNRSVRRYYKSIDIATTYEPNLYPQWTLLEIPVSPGFPVKYATFNLTTKGFWAGYALFDDAALRPSHSRVCNCSSGFYHNESEPTARKCVRCPPGFACSGGHLVRCENSWSVSVSTGCNACWDGWLCDADGRGRLIPCEPYTKLDSDKERCSPCPMGHSCRDGVQYVCNNGQYGDGGLDCIVCEPGYFSPNSGVPEIQCQRCPPGTTSNPGRNGCVSCTAEHFSPDGKQCAQCPAGEFILQGGHAGCRPCTNHFLDNFNVSVYRNSPGKSIRIVPATCVLDFDFQVERVEHLDNVLGEVQINDVTPSVLYLAGNVLGVHKFRVWVTSEYQAHSQYADVGVEVFNREPVVQDDVIWLTHPPVPITYNLTFVLFNDYDLDMDNIFFTTATFTGATYGATNLVIGANRRTLTVDLPQGFLGPIPISYGIMDKYYATVAECIPPTCRFAATTASVTLGSRQAPPFAQDDTYTVPNGKVRSLDVLVNDGDPENDEIRIIATSTATFGTVPAMMYSCNQAATCGTQACAGLTSCTCSTDAARNKCYPDIGREMFIDYTALATACGWDRFSYTIETNDGTATAWVDVRVTNCYCASHTPGVDIIFLLDSTANKNDFGWQLAFVEAVQKRSSGTDFNYGAYDIGRNTEMQALANTYIDPVNFRGSTTPEAYSYDLGAGMIAAYNMKIAAGVPARPTVILIVSGKPSEDGLIGSAISAFNGLPTTTMIRHYTVGDLSKTVFDDLATSYVFNSYNFEALVNDEGVAAEQAMDDICAMQP